MYRAPPSYLRRLPETYGATLYHTERDASLCPDANAHRGERKSHVRDIEPKPGRGVHILIFVVAEESLTYRGGREYREKEPVVTSGESGYKPSYGKGECYKQAFKPVYI